MDPLTHVCLPLTAAVAVEPAVLGSPARAATAGFTLFPDLDKFAGTDGLFQSLVLLVPLSLALFLAERRLRGTRTLATLATAFLASHLVLDTLDGGPVTLLYPFVESGVGLRFPADLVFGEGPLGIVRIEGPLVALRDEALRPGRHRYEFFGGYGVASVLLLGTVLAGRRLRGEPCA